MKNRRFLSVLLMLGMVLGGLAACGDDSGDSGGDGGGSDTTEADSGDDGGGEGANAEVEAYCEEAAELGEQLQAAIDDPTSADAAAITQQANDLTAAAADLITANPDDVDRINECGEALQVTP